MYFPYLRGKQFELLALKEFATGATNKKYFNPVIEIVRIPVAKDGLQRTIDVLVANRIHFTLIVNPTVGMMNGTDSSATQEPTKAILEYIKALDIPADKFDIALILESQTLQSASELIIESGLTSKVDLIFRTTLPSKSEVDAVINHHNIGYLLVPDKEENILSYFVNLNNPKYVKIYDRFPFRDSNKKYVDVPASIFSTDHQYFEKSGYIGFGDFLTIGDRFSEGGSRPLAVVIHFTYLDKDGALVIKHFHSVSNNDVADTAGKFSEALDALTSFVATLGYTNPAIDKFIELQRNHTFPGLGVIKKLSILNHLHQVDRYFGL